MKYLGKTFLFTLIFSTSLNAIALAPKETAEKDKTAQLLHLLLDRYTPLQPAQISKLLAEGAKIEGRNRSHATPLVLAAETFAYQSAMPEKTRNLLLPQTLETIKILIQAGANVSAQDGRGATAIGYLLTYAAFPTADEAMDLFLKAGSDLNVAGHDDGTRLIHLMLTVGARAEAPVLKMLNKYSARIQFRARSKAGRNPLHAAATARPLPSGTNWIRELMKHVPSHELEAMAREKDESGNTPFLLAAISGNVENLKALVDIGSPKNDINLEGDNALDLTTRLGQTDSTHFLKSIGLMIYRPVSTTISCGQELPSPLTWTHLEKYILTCPQTNTVEQLMSILPKTTRSHYVLVFAGRGLQVGSKTFPRMLLFGTDAGVILSINGHKKHNGHLSVEAMNLNQETKRLELREIDFSNQKKGPTISSVNPDKCTICHSPRNEKNDPRPLWSNWTIWPGVYFGEMMNLYPEEKKWYQKFQRATRNHPRYSKLLPQSLHPIFTNNQWDKTSNFLPRITMDFGPMKLDALIDSINSQRFYAAVQKEISPLPQKWAVLAAMTCTESIQDFLPQNDVIYSAARLAAIDVDMKARARSADYEMKSFVQTSTDGKGNVGRYQLENTTFGENYYKNFPRVGANFAHDVVVKTRFILDPIFGEEYLQRWSFDFTRHASLSFAGFDFLEHAAWKALVPQRDTELYPLIQKAMEGADKLPRVLSFLRSGDEKTRQKACEILKVRSLSALK